MIAAGRRRPTFVRRGEPGGLRAVFVSWSRSPYVQTRGLSHLWSCTGVLSFMCWMVYGEQTLRVPNINKSDDVKENCAEGWEEAGLASLHFFYISGAKILQLWVNFLKIRAYHRSRKECGGEG